LGARVEVDLDIYTFDIDIAAHVSNITYVRWLEIGRLQLLREIGLPVEQLVASGIAPVLTHTEITYRRALVLGDPVRLAVWVDELRAASARLGFEITSGEHLVATARQKGLFVNLDTGRPHRLAGEMRARFEPYLG